MTQIVASVALLLFALLMLGIGLYSARHTKNLDGFLLGGRKIGAWMSAFAYGTSYFSAVIFIGYAGKFGWDIGFPSMWIGFGNAVFGCLLAWKLLARRTRTITHALDARTMPEFFAGRYLSKRMKIFAAVIIFVFLVPYAAGVYKGLGSLFGAIFPNISTMFWGIPADTICMFIVALLTGFYLILGGYVASAITDFVQGIIMLVGVFVMVIALLAHPNVGGFAGAVTRLRAVNPSLTSLFGGDNWRFLLINILLTSFGTWGLPQMVHKFYAVRDEHAIRRGTVISSVFALIIGCGAYLVGTLGQLVLQGKLPSGGYDAVVPTMLIAAFGQGLVGNILLSVILLLVLSASMSTLSAVVLTSASAISVDFVQVFKNPPQGKNQMRLTRVLCLLFVAMSFVFATFRFAIIVSIMSFSWGVVSGCFIGPFIWGLYRKGITRAGSWAGMIGGLSTILIWTFVAALTHPDMAQGFGVAFQAVSKDAPTYGIAAMAVSFLLVPLVSLFTKPYDKAHIDRVFADVPTKAR